MDIIEFSLVACTKLVKISLENFENTKQNKTKQNRTKKKVQRQTKPNEIVLQNTRGGKFVKKFTLLTQLIKPYYLLFLQ